MGHGDAICLKQVSWKETRSWEKLPNAQLAWRYGRLIISASKPARTSRAAEDVWIALEPFGYDGGGRY